MKIVYSDAHRQHQPPFEIFEGGQVLPIFENPDRMDRILAALRQAEWAEMLPPQDFGLEPILAIHAADYVNYLRTAFADWQKEGGQVNAQQSTPVLLAATFPPRRSRHISNAIAARAGYYSFDLSCPLVEGTYLAAVVAAHCALTGAQLLLNGDPAAFALCRPPGHHAGRDFAGGYCYLNNACIAARHLAARGRVALLDVDYHSGNGTQDIFYDSAEVLTISLHADPARQYPYFVGYADETGEGSGLGYHRNFPLAPGIGDTAYCQTLAEALTLIHAYAPHYLVVSFGADTFVDDPLGDLAVTRDGFRRIGAMIAALKLPTLVAMEGGYANDALGQNTAAFLLPFV